MVKALFVLVLAATMLGCATALPSTAPATPAAAEKTPQPTSQPTQDIFTEPRLSMVREQIELRGVNDPAVLEAMRQVERHRFVPQDYIDQAYDDHPLPIGYGQTISQPYIVALMTRELGIQPGDRVLEIGTGSGYQAAVLAQMGIKVFTIEIVPELAEQAEKRLDELGYENARVLNADGYFGWEAHAPYDAVIVTAAPDHLPQPLVNQLEEGGRLVIPIGPVGAVQTLWRFELVDGELQAENLGAVRFVPFTRAPQ
jgi:protein-L-isoaspartate(D-aspartate) O-methyltransferase